MVERAAFVKMVERAEDIVIHLSFVFPEFKEVLTVPLDDMLKKLNGMYMYDAIIGVYTLYKITMMLTWFTCDKADLLTRGQVFFCPPLHNQLNILEKTVNP